MVHVYTAQLITDAYLIRGLLENNGIPAFVSGGYLQGAIGELPAMGMITVSVAGHQAEQAAALIADFERAKPDQEDEPSDQNC